jgi:hypothetical protein
VGGERVALPLLDGPARAWRLSSVSIPAAVHLATPPPRIVTLSTPTIATFARRPYCLQWSPVQQE